MFNLYQKAKARHAKYSQKLCQMLININGYLVICGRIVNWALAELCLCMPLWVSLRPFGAAAAAGPFQNNYWRYNGGDYEQNEAGEG